MWPVQIGSNPTTHGVEGRPEAPGLNQPTLGGEGEHASRAGRTRTTWIGDLTSTGPAASAGLRAVIAVPAPLTVKLVASTEPNVTTDALSAGTCP
jgi:hypothetical protein